jgi:hypothetical protein
MVPKRVYRLPLMALGVLALLTGMWTGLLRLGWDLPLIRPGLAAHHGPLMVSGFLGTLISLERAVALNRWWGYGAPVLTGLGALALIAGLPGVVGSLLMTLGSGVTSVLFGIIVRRQPAPYTVTMGLGAFIWLVGNVFWLAGWPIFMVVPWWIGFLTLTIAGERLELSRVLQLSRWSLASYLVALGLFLSGAVLSLGASALGARLSGLGLVLLACWLLRYDLARRTIHTAGLPRFIAVCLLSGYLWLGVAGAVGLRFGVLAAGPQYDAMLHALFLGFVTAMVFGHAPVIFPAVLGARVPFHPAFYAHLILLHLSLILRVVGDLTLWWPGRQWGGLLNALALVLFLVNAGRAILTAPAKEANRMSRPQGL